jgi:hypothetical protein
MLLILLAIRHTFIIPNLFPDDAPIILLEAVGKLVRLIEQGFEEFLLSAPFEENSVIFLEQTTAAELSLGLYRSSSLIFLPHDSGHVDGLQCSTLSDSLMSDEAD